MHTCDTQTKTRATYKNICVTKYDTLSFFWLMMRLTMVVKWWLATIMPPSSVPSSYAFSRILYKILDLKVNCSDGGVAISAGVDCTGS